MIFPRSLGVISLLLALLLNLLVFTEAGVDGTPELGPGRPY